MSVGVCGGVEGEGERRTVASDRGRDLEGAAHVDAVRLPVVVPAALLVVSPREDLASRVVPPDRERAW